MPAKRSSAARQRQKPRATAPRPTSRKAVLKSGTAGGKGDSKILAHLGPEALLIAFAAEPRKTR